MWFERKMLRFSNLTISLFQIFEESEDGNLIDVDLNGGANNLGGNGGDQASGGGPSGGGGGGGGGGGMPVSPPGFVGEFFV